jgi:hypothetical protein
LYEYINDVNKTLAHNKLPNQRTDYSKRQRLVVFFGSTGMLSLKTLDTTAITLLSATWWADCDYSVPPRYNSGSYIDNEWREIVM